MTKFEWMNTLADDETWSVVWQGKTWTIPHHMRESMALWFDEGRWIGGHFLTAIFENNLAEAVGRADAQNLEILIAYPIWLYNNAPGGSFGSPKRMKVWAEYKARTREASTSGSSRMHGKS